MMPSERRKDGHMCILYILKIHLNLCHRRLLFQKSNVPCSRLITQARAISTPKYRTHSVLTFQLLSSPQIKEMFLRVL